MTKATAVRRAMRSTVLLATACLPLACAAPGALPDPAASRSRPAASQAAHGTSAYWRLEDLARPESGVAGLASGSSLYGAVETRLLQDILATANRIIDTAEGGPRPELLLIANQGVAAFAFQLEGRPAIALSLGMVWLLGSDMDAWAALLGHELAHLRLGHLAQMRERRERTQTVGSLAGLMLSAAGLPFASVATDATASAARASVSRGRSEAPLRSIITRTAAGTMPRAIAMGRQSQSGRIVSPAAPDLSQSCTHPWPTLASHNASGARGRSSTRRSNPGTTLEKAARAAVSAVATVAACSTMNRVLPATCHTSTNTRLDPATAAT